MPARAQGASQAAGCRSEASGGPHQGAGGQLAGDTHAPGCVQEGA